MLYLIAHAPWAPGRKASLARLLDQLPEAVVIASRGREHAAIWARRVWERAADYDGHACDMDPNPSSRGMCILNDDVVLAPDFRAIVERAVKAQPLEPISLHCGNANVAAIPGAWARCYHYSGPGVILPPGAAADLLEYVYGLPWSMLARMNEDNIGCAWAWDRQRPFWYLLPSPLTHDTTVRSTLGYDHHPHRVPVLGPELPERDVTDLTAPFVELEWCRTEALKYRRLVLQAGRKLCFLCVGREGVVGTGDVVLCRECLAEMTSAALRSPR